MEKEKEIEQNEVRIPTPKQLYEILDKYVIGQSEAKKHCRLLYITITKGS